jgi:hypothetical protein
MGVVTCLSEGETATVEEIASKDEGKTRIEGNCARGWRTKLRSIPDGDHIGKSREILDNQKREGWGAKIIDRLATDLQRAFPNLSG